VLRCPGAKDSINQEPYQSLPLDIQPDNVHTIEDAIANMTLPEIMHDYTSPKGLKVEATKQVYLEGLPPVLILHMKRFVFDNVGGVQKLSKRVNYESKLTIHPEWLVPAMRGGEPITYQLFGSVYHHGTSAGGGHYTCDIKRRTGEWLHIDDTTITSVSEQDVLVTEENTRTSEKLHAGQTAYILFYVRSS
jgi:ubiquitin C-terminal hydrolase